MTRWLHVALHLAGALGLACLVLLTFQAQSRAQEVTVTDRAPELVDPGTILINEVMADNRTTLVDPDENDEMPDWLELYNPLNQAVSLGGLALSDNPENPTKFPISNVLTIPALGYIVFYADEDTRQGPRHTNFKLGAGGESLSLYRVADKVKIDELTFPALAADQSYGRLPDGGAARKLDFPTPGASNATDPPRITQVSEPPYPAPENTPISVTAVVSDADQIVAVSLVFSTTHLGMVTVAAANPQTVTMTSLGNQLYQGDLPAMPAGTLVSYYVTAVDVNGESNRFPLKGQEYRLLTGYVAPTLLMNEIVIRNTTIPDPNEPAEYPDWFEIYNPTDRPISLNGLSLSDDKSEPLKYRIPAGWRIEAKQRLVVLADDDKGQTGDPNNPPPGGAYIHVNFSLRGTGEFVAIFGGEGTVRIDSRDLKRAPRIGSYSRLPDGETWMDMGCYTFNEPNQACDHLQYMPVVGRQ